MKAEWQHFYICINKKTGELSIRDCEPEGYKLLDLIEARSVGEAIDMYVEAETQRILLRRKQRRAGMSESIG